MEEFDILSQSDIWDELIDLDTRERKTPRLQCDDAKELRDAALRGDVRRMEELLLSRTWSRRALLAALKVVKSVEGVLSIANRAPRYFHAGGGATALFHAAKTGSVDTVRALLAAGVPVDASPSWSREGVTALHLAAAYGSSEATAALLSAGARVNAITQGVQALHLAAHFGHEHCVASLLAGGASIEESDSEGWRALHHASAQGFVDCVRVLLDSGAYVDAPGECGCTALFTCNIIKPYAFRDHASRTKPTFARCVALLLERGANPNHCDEEGSTPLGAAITYHDLDIIKGLIAAGADIWHRNFSGETLLHVGVSGLGDKVDHLPWIVGLGLDVNAKASDGSTPLHNAVRNFFNDGVKTLLTLGAYRDAQDLLGCTPLHIASTYENTSILTILIEAGANVNLPAVDGSTAIHGAARASHYCLEILLQVGADVHAKTVAEETAVHFAATCWRTQSLEILQYLGMDLHAVDVHGWTCLHHAVSAAAGFTDTIRWLLKRNLSPRCASVDGSTPLHLAASAGNTRAVKLLLAHGASVRAVDQEGQTALHKAARGTEEDLVRVLLEGGAERDATDANGDTAAGLAKLPEVQRMIQRWALAA